MADLLAGATERAGLAEVPGKSGATLERVVIDGQGYVLKHLDLAEDWTMRASGCLPGAPLVLWERGILARLPGCLNQPIVGAAPEPHGCALLTRDVTPWLVPATDAPVPLDQHARLLRHMAAMQADFWACGDEFTSCRPCTLPGALAWMAAAEAAVGSRHLVPLAGRQGLAAAGRGRPRGGRGCHPAGARPGSAGGGAGRELQTFVHSNWKLDNLGTDDAGRTVVLDWEQPGRGAHWPTWPGTSRSTAAACPSPRRPRSRPTGRRWRPAASTPGPGGTVSWRCACWVPVGRRSF